MMKQIYRYFNKKRNGSLSGNLSLCLLASILLFCAACTDEDSFFGSVEEGTVTLVLPGVLTRAGDSDNGDVIKIEEGTEAEGGIDAEKGLWFFAFKTGDKGRTVIRKIIPAELEEDDTHKLFSVNLEYGNYKFYLAGNIPNLENVRTANELEGTVLSYTSNLTTELRPGNLPMYREGIEVEVNSASQEKIDMHMTFLCAKVQLGFKSADPEKNFTVSGMTLNHVASQSIVDLNSCKSITLEENQFISNITLPLSATETSETGISVSGNTETKLPAFYLPEYYPDKKNGTVSFLKFTVRQTGLEESKEFTLKLGGEDTTGTTSVKEFLGGNLERGNHYEMTANIASMTKDLTVNLSIFKWNTETLDVDFSKTTLWVAKTGGERNSDDTYKETNDTILATSLVPATVAYRTNASKLTFTCDQIKGNDILIPQYTSTTDGNGYITFTINPAILLKDFGEKTAGAAKVTITANNLKKEIWVDYNVTPFLTVSPTLVVFNADKESEKDQTVTYSTNLLGEASLTSNDHRLTLNQDSKTITISKGTTNTDSYTFEIKVSSQSTDVVLTQAINVIYKRSNIRVNFIAINDKLDKGPADSESMGLIPLRSASGTTDENYDYEESLPQIYTNYSTSDYSWGVPKINDNEMSSYGSNDNWYYYDFTTQPANLSFSSSNTETFFYKLPGSGKNGNDTPYQYPYNNGKMNIFNFENKEGWLVWDPTVEACGFMDFKPEIVDVSYDVYVYSETPVQGVRWYRRFGWIKQNVGRFLIQSETDTNGEYDKYPVYFVGKNWYKCTITLKAMKHDKHKNIKLIFRTAEGSIDTGVLYGGEDFSVENTTGNTCAGYYDKDGTWGKGVPSEATTTGNKTNVTIESLIPFGDENPSSTQGNNGYIRVYFYNPQEPSSWVNGVFRDEVYLHMGFTQGGGGAWPTGGVTTNDFMEPVVIEKSRIPNWYYYEISNKNFHDGQHNGQYHGRWLDFRNYSGQVLYLAFRNRLYDSSHDDGGNLNYKSDLWAWANMYNGFYPDIRIPYTEDNRRKDRYTDNLDSYIAAAFYCMDGKCYLNKRPR